MAQMHVSPPTTHPPIVFRYLDLKPTQSQNGNFASGETIQRFPSIRRGGVGLEKETFPCGYRSRDFPFILFPKLLQYLPQPPQHTLSLSPPELIPFFGLWSVLALSLMDNNNRRDPQSLLGPRGTPFLVTHFFRPTHFNSWADMFVG
ncbi:hypothetical protein CEXT_147301 [Caerostris extrusa]|uniref:Uncharacterized protein n=1 Tax=Caerostris extrusa TaxID=172846 RepID=A0AAV4SVP0_CAEEX|nr:hypothetical protein CEXT_147301 [Caerostris extrusa]